MAPLLLRTKAESASSGIGFGASFAPATLPCPSKPWHCQHPCFTKAALPFSTDPAAATGEAKASPAMIAASARKWKVGMIPASVLARLRPDIEQRRLARLHHRDGFLERGAEQ